MKKEKIKKGFVISTADETFSCIRSLNLVFCLVKGAIPFLKKKWHPLLSSRVSFIKTRRYPTTDR